MLEGHRQRVVAVVGARRRHVHHVLDAVDLLLDRRGDGLGHHLRAGAGVLAAHARPSAARSGGTWRSAGSDSASPPASVMAIESTEAKIGRSMKKRVEHGGDSRLKLIRNEDHLPSRPDRDAVSDLPGEPRGGRSFSRASRRPARRLVARRSAAAGARRQRLRWPA